MGSVVSLGRREEPTVLVGGAAGLGKSYGGMAINT